MTTMYRAQVNWQGFPGAPGYTFLYATTTDPLQTGADAFGQAVQTMLSHWKNQLPSGVSIQLDTACHLIEDTTGNLDDILTFGFAPTNYLSGNAGVFAGPAGMCVDWLTSTVVAGKRRQGRSFIVPISSVAMQGDGTLQSAAITEVASAAATYIAAAGVHPVVWSRPVVADPNRTPPRAARAGVAVPISAARVPDKVVVLRSRRD